MTSTAHTRQGRPAPGRAFGSTVSAVFGLVFVGINSAGLAAPLRIALLAVGVAGLVAVLVLAAKDRGAPAHSPHSPSGHGPLFGRTYWIIVALEVVALFAGVRVVTGALGPTFGVAWVSLVVGIHFFFLGQLFRLCRFHVMGALVTACGAAGFLLGYLGSPEAIAPVSGVLPGLILLGFGIWAMLPARRAHMG